MPADILPDIRGGKPLPRDPWRVITALEQRLDAAEQRIAKLEAERCTVKRGPGRPRKNQEEDA
jgi:hypothetical protein